MPTADVLATVKWDTLTHQYKLSLIQLFNKGYFEMFPHALAEQFIIHSNRSASRTKHGLMAQRFASNYVKNSIAYRGTVLWNAISRSNGSILDCTQNARGARGGKEGGKDVSLPPSSRAPRVSLAPKTPFPKTPFPFPFKRLPRRLRS